MTLKITFYIKSSNLLALCLTPLQGDLKQMEKFGDVNSNQSLNTASTLSLPGGDH